MKKYLSIFMSAVLSGWCITIGAAAYLSLVSTQKIVGAFLFGLGLFVIIHFQLHLYTGRVGTLLDHRPKYILELIVCVAGNIIGVLILAGLLRVTRIGDTLCLEAMKIVEAKQEDSWYSIFLLSVMCGIMIYLATAGHKRCEYALGKALFCFLAIAVFIVCGFEHCVAGAAYYTFAGYFDLRSLLYLLLMVIGNGLGAVILDGMLKLIGYLKREEQQN